MSIKSVADFVNKGPLHSCRRLMRRGSLLAPLFTIAALSTTGCTGPSSFFASSASLPPTMGGYPEDRTIEFSAESNGLKIFEKYIKEKKELAKAIVDCRHNLNSCDPDIKEFSDDIDYLKTIKNKSVQIFMINAIMNCYLIYDNNEALNSETDLEDHSLLQVVKTHRAICHEYAEIKLYIAEALGFNAYTDVRLVAEDSYSRNGRDPCGDGHMVLEIRDRNKFDILDTNSIDSIDKLQPGDIFSYTIAGGELEDSNVHVNFSGHNMWNDTTFYLPDYEFSSAQIAAYSSDPPKKDLSNVPRVARYAPRNIQVLDGATYYNIHATPIMRKVLLSHLVKMTKNENSEIVATREETTCNTEAASRPSPIKYASRKASPSFAR